MNALRDLTTGVGCSTDGTAATANPLTGLINQAMGMGGQQKGGMNQPGGLVGARSAPQVHQSEMERAMAAGMGLSRGVDSRSPFERALGPQFHQQSPFERSMGGGDALAREFQQQFRGGPPANLLGPRGHAPMPMNDQWLNDFARMNVRGDPYGPQSARTQGWMADMARGPPPAEMERAWRQKNAMEGQAWAQEMARQQEQQAQEQARAASAMEKDPLAQAWTQADSGMGAMGDMDAMFEKAWREGDMNEAEMDKAFQEMMVKMQAEAGANYESAWGDSMLDYPSVSPLEQTYELETNNPFANSANAFEEGMRHFNGGNLRDAVLAFQAVVGKEPNHSEAWRMLGVVHQENDEDKKAILCLERAVEHDAYNLDALLGLGVSYVNELDHHNALKNLKSWVINNPNFVGLEVHKDEYSDGTMMDEVMQLMLKAAEWAPKDAQVQEVLGVLFNVTRDYSSASAAFRKAVDARPDDYSLWNKVGATLANSTPSRSEEAVPAYLRAIELRPGYARAHLNLGISYNNMGNFEAAARAYMRALELSPSATHIWQYLRISFTCMERSDLVALCDAKDLMSLKKMFPA